MTSKYARTAAKEAALRGAAVLDKELGRGWRRKIRRSRLKMERGIFYPSIPTSCGCILSQVDVITNPKKRSGSYVSGTQLVFGRFNWRHLSMYGFTREPSSPYTYDDLTEAWKEVLRGNRD